jgi:hypothetical protein
MLMPALFASVVDISAGCLLRISRRLSLELEISLICRFGGTVVKSTGDGHLTTFDGPTQAIRCSEAMRADAKTLGIEIRPWSTVPVDVQGDEPGGAVGFNRRGHARPPGVGAAEDI